MLFAEADSGMKLIFTVDFDRHAMLWGPFNEAALLGLVRSLVFVAAVGILLGRRAWSGFRYRFSLLVFGVAMAEALLLVESGERLYHANLWWGPFICYWLFLLESVSVWLRSCTAWKAGTREGHLGLRLGPVRCGAGMACHQWVMLPGAADAGQILQHPHCHLSFSLFLNFRRSFPKGRGRRFFVCPGLTRARGCGSILLEVSVY